MARNNKTAEEKNIKQAIEEFNIEEHKKSEEIKELKILRREQAYNTGAQTELMHLEESQSRS